MEPKKLRLIEFTGRFHIPRKLPDKQVAVTRKVPTEQVTAPRRMAQSRSKEHARSTRKRIMLFICGVLLACVAKGFVRSHPWIAVWLGLGAAASVGRALTITR